MRFPPSFLDDIRARVPISDVIGQRVTFDRRKSRPAKGDHWACCPFHGENSPSFHCEDDKGRYHCFGCGVSGDHFRFLTELDGLSFPEAVERLAGMAGLAMPARDPEAEKRDEKRATILDALKLAAEFFRDRLQDNEGAKARGYLRDRGLNPAIQKRFGLGFAPEARNRLKEHLAAKGVGKKEIEAAGLVVHGDDIAVSYDRFRDRIMFPILDPSERCVAFGGRAMSPEARAKYLNSPETDVFHKGGMLYNLGMARRASKNAGTLLVVEGYMDVIALAQAGFDHAVAPLGTALTESQIELLWRSAGDPILCFDGDGAGIKAAHRAAELALPLLKPGRSLRFALLPDGKDPDDLVKDGGADAFRDVLAQARPLSDMVWSRETAGSTFDTPEARAELERRLDQLTRQIGDESVRRHYSQDMRQRLSAFFGSGSAPRSYGDRSNGRGGDRGQRGDRGGYANAVGGRQSNGRYGAGAGMRPAISDRLARSSLLRATGGPAPSLREIAIVVGFVNHPVLMQEAFDYFADLEIDAPDLARLRACVLDIYAESAPHDRDVIIEGLRLRGAEEIFIAYEEKARMVRLWPVLADAAADDAREALRQALHLQHRFKALTRELKQAEQLLGQEPTDDAYEHMRAVKAEIERVETIEALVEGFGILSGRAVKTM
ncbi:DNA primase [Fulvimarina sp. 2208YS6-2-32]|uniref:DNA primase n=1 Tax=Fulvimarina uroteuthidis TaxID=3098149 RepID=A0ABU5I2S4_9HYPH|nr:DNA primase [Fulvimarina sp. 2208YS6-2-32]MDY8109669.1 DNA primase [Fulvimarina sp. 2208YS6-2-32]